MKENTPKGNQSAGQSALASSANASDTTPVVTLLRNTARYTGTEFFGELARNLATELGASSAFVSELCAKEPQQLRLLAFFTNGDLQGTFEYATAGTPCAQVLGQGQACYRERARQLFPEDKWFQDAGIESYHAVAIHDRTGEAVGHIGIADTKPIRDQRGIATVLEIFAQRAAAELERLTAQGALERLQSRYDLSTRGSTVGLWDWDIIHDQLWWSPSLYAQLGIEETSTLPTIAAFREQLHPDDSDRVMSAIEQHLYHRRPYATEFRLRSQSGGYRWFFGRGQALWNDDGKPIRMSGSCLDISRRRRAERLIQSLVASTVDITGQDCFDTIVTEVCGFLGTEYAAISILDDNGQLRTLAKSVDGTLSREGAHAIADTPCMLAVERGYFVVEEGLGKAFDHDRRLRGFEGEGYVGLVLRDRAQKPIGVLCTLSRRRITEAADCRQILEIVGARAAAEVERRQTQAEQARLEERIRHTQKLESLGRLAGGIAHDFNNLLVGVLGNAEFGLAHTDADSELCEILSDISRSAHRASELTNQLLAFSGKGNFVVGPLQINSSVRESVQMLELLASQNAEIRYDLQDDLPAIAADPIQIRQVLINLITNASESLDSHGGIISLKTGVVTCDRPQLDAMVHGTDLECGTYVFVEVSDTGHGMDKDTAEHIFDPFFTTRFTGRGLGLAAALGIVQGHRGAIKLESTPGKGTSFQILLPALASADYSTADARDQEDVDEPAANLSILLVDDEEMVRNVGRRLLEKLGAKVQVAEHGKQAIELYDDSIDLVILDLTMPVMDGVECLRQLRERHRDVCVLLSSGYSDDEVQRKYGNNDLAGFLPKPYNLDTLRRALADARNCTCERLRVREAN